MNKRVIAAVAAAAALAVPAAAVAHPGSGKGHKKPAKQKTVAFVFKGTFVAPGTVEVLSGNAHVRKGGFVGQQVAFDFAAAKVVVADTNADHATDVADVKDGDRVVVHARIAKGTKLAAPAETEEAAAAIVARKLVDQTNAPVEDDVEATPAS